jgi:glucose-1-phosphate thymidylyltransferase
MKGIVLAGGAGSRLDPITRVASKQLQPVYDKPMIYYPLATLMQAGISEILLISTPHDCPGSKLLGDGSQWGIRVDLRRTARTQGHRPGVPCRAPSSSGSTGHRSSSVTTSSTETRPGRGLQPASTVEPSCSATRSAIPERYGVVEFDPDGRVVSLEEKPATRSRATPFPVSTCTTATWSDRRGAGHRRHRGELEITDLNRAYLDRKGQLRSRSRPGHRLAGQRHPRQLLEAANFIATIERRQSIKIACLEEIALDQGYITP